MKISVVIAAYNVENYIEECLESVISQELVDKEIIVINDGSTDKTLERIQRFKASVRLINQENMGPSFTLNKGIKLANGDLISFLDGDDIWTPDKLYKQHEVFLKYPKTEVSFGQIQQFLSPELAHKPERYQFNKEASSGFLKGTCMVRKVVFIENGFFPESSVGLEFIMWFERVKALGINYHQTEEVFTLRRIREGSLSQNENYYPELLRILKSRIDKKRV